MMLGKNIKQFPKHIWFVFKFKSYTYNFILFNFIQILSKQNKLSIIVFYILNILFTNSASVGSISRVFVSLFILYPKIPAPTLI